MASLFASNLPAEQKPLPADAATSKNLPYSARWLPFASFVIEFQVQFRDGYAPTARTKAHHIEADTCATWPDVASPALCQWLLAQIQLTQPNHPTLT